MCNQWLINGNMIILSSADAVSHLLERIKSTNPFAFTFKNSVHFYIFCFIYKIANNKKKLA